MQIKQVLKYPFPIYLKLNYMLQFLIVLISILISLLKLFFLVNMSLWVYYETIVVDIPSSDQGDLISSK